MAEQTEETLDVEKIEVKGGHLRRNSTGNLDILNSGVKVLPHYLRASVGSCHDFCKHGMKHDTETKSRIPMPKRSTLESQNLDRTVNSVQKYKTSTSLISPKPMLDSKSQIPDKEQVIKKVVISSKQKQQEQSVISPKPFPEQQVIRKEVPASAKKVAISSKRVSSPREGIDVSAKHASDRKQQVPLLNRSKTLPNSKNRIPDKQQVIKKEVPASAKKVAISSKQVSSPRDGTPKSPFKTKLSSLSIPGHLSTRRFSEIIIPKGVEALKLSPAGGSNSRVNRDINTSKEDGMRKKNDTVSPTFFLAPKRYFKSVLSLKSESHKSPKRVSHLKNQNTLEKDESREENVPEKTLYVIKTEPEDFTQNDSSEVKSLGYDQTGMHTSQFPPSSEDKNPNGIQSPPSESSLQIDESSPISECSGNEIANQKVEHKMRDCSPRRLNFRRGGELTDVQSENNSPRKLRFRQGKVQDENQTQVKAADDTKRRSFRRAAADGKLNGTKPESEKVVLRHQHVQGKKDVQSLFNNVIEETASKLVQTRKSKVKALVGAFETVISLQDTNFSATNY
uniref:Putative muscle M-line assembly protein unc-89 isoform X2 n=1 Tax=Davidia involucrata TaxID=16924 RepID=A0A5B7BSX6_DAVIN